MSISGLGVWGRVGFDFGLSGFHVVFVAMQSSIGVDGCQARGSPAL